MRVLVAGANGLIGSAVLARLNRDDYDLIAAGRSGAADAIRALGRSRFQQAHRSGRLAAAAGGRRCGGELRRRAGAGRPRRHQAHPCPRHRGAVRCLRAGWNPRHSYFCDRRLRRGHDRLRAHQGAGRRASRCARSRLDDPAAGAGDGAGGLWRHGDAARPRGISRAYADACARRPSPPPCSMCWSGCAGCR